MEWAQAATIVSALAAFTGVQALWISRALDRVYAALDRLDVRLDHIERVVLRDHGERIARLEAERD
ncbi:MAG TPA: hypothetical protein VFG70_01050 [Gaiellaceae bacterium]|jgi:hypothetical protein|nr:hypothetical protein [Gaiellaceae bacterium]